MAKDSPDTSKFRVWTPINNFTGIFCGEGKTISGLYYNGSSDYVGLFGSIGIGGTVQEVGVVDSYLKGNQYVGGVAGYNYSTVTSCCNTGAVSGTGYYVGGVAGYNEGTLMSCCNSGSVTGESGFVGGMVGYNIDGSMESCYNTGIVTGDDNVGGVVGKNYNATVTSCYNTGAVSGTGYYVGGVAGYSNWSSVTNCYSTGNVEATDSHNIGGVLGYKSGGTAENCYYLTGTAIGGINNADVVGEVEPKTAEEFASGEVAYLLQGEQTDQVWGQNIDNGETAQNYPVFSDARVYRGYTSCAEESVIVYTNDSGIFAEKPSHSTSAEGDSPATCMKQAFCSVCKSEYGEVDETNHVAYENGFCLECGAYQPAELVGTYYQIANAGQLYWFAAQVNSGNTAINGELKADIVVNENVLTADGTLNGDGSAFRVWTPIGTEDNAYTGEFRGGGNTVSGLYFNSRSADYVGLFGYVGSGTVNHVGVIDSYFKAGWYVGGVAGLNKGTLQYVYNTGNVNGSRYAGGVTGENNYIVEYAYNTGTVFAMDYAGGVTGYNNYIVQYAYNTGFAGGAAYYGGIAGDNRHTLKDCYYLADSETETDALDGTTAKTADQFASGEVAYLLGDAFGQNIDNGETVQTLPVLSDATVYAVQNCKNEVAYSNTNENIGHIGGTATCIEKAVCTVCGASYGAVGEHSTTAEGDIAADCNSKAYCSVCESYYGEVDTTNHDETVAYENGFCPNGCYEPATDSDSDGYYEIDNAGKLYWFAAQVNSGNTAINGKLTQNIVVNEGTLTAETTDARAWTPIGQGPYLYNGTFNGGEFTVSGLYCGDSSADYASLFGAVDDEGIVENVGVIDSYLNGTAYAGGVVGQNWGTVASCYNTGTVCGSAYVGGVVSRNAGTVINCYNTGNVTGINSSIGGVVGCSDDGTVASCYNTGAVSGDYSVGGVVGTSDISSVKNCYNTGNVTGADSVGGVVGSSYNSTVENCYNIGFVSGIANYVGGVIGINKSTVTNCYYLSGYAVDGNSTVQFGIGNPYLGGTTADIAGQTAGKFSAQFASGEVAYLLSHGENGSIWGQDLDNGKAKQTTPTFTGAKVYCGYTSCGDTAEKYTNDETVSAEKPAHAVAATYTLTEDGKKHIASYSCCGTAVTEEHNFENDAHKCVCGVIETFTVYWGGMYHLGLVTSTSTYGQDFVQVIPVPENTHLRIDDVYLRSDSSIHVNYTYENGVLTIAALDLPAADIDIDCYHYVKVTCHANGGVIKPDDGFPVEGDNGFAENASYWVQEWPVSEPIYPLQNGSAIRAGYTFVEWRDESGKVYPTNDAVKATVDVTIYAQWQANTYTVTWNVDGETSTTQQTYDAALVLPTAPEKVNCSFLGWFTAEEGGEQVTAETIFQNANNSTVYYARWCDHGGENPTYVDGKCGICGYVCTHKTSHHESYTDLTDTTHNFLCTVCNQTIQEAHRYDTTTHRCDCGQMEPGWYTVTYPNFVELEHCVGMTVSPDVAQAETTVTVVVEMEDGYSFEGMAVTAADRTQIPHTTDETGNITTMTFVMPEQNVQLIFAKPSVYVGYLAEGLVYTGDELSLVQAAEVSNGTLQFSLDGVEWTEEWPKATDVGTYSFEYRVLGNEGYMDLVPVNVPVRIGKAEGCEITGDITIVNNVANTYTVDLSGYDPTFGSWGGNASYALGTVSFTDSGYYTSGVKIEDNKLILPINKVESTEEGAVGTVTVKITSRNFEESTLTLTVNRINHAHVWSYSADETTKTITAKCANTDGHCNDTEQSFTLNAPDVGYSGNPVEAEVTRDGTDLTFTLHYTGTNYDSADAPTSAGDYTVTMTVGDKSVSDTFTISPKDVSKVASCQFSLTRTSFVYSGKSPVLNVTGVDSSVGSYTMQKGTDYTVGTVQVNAGSHKLTVTGIGNYTGTVELAYTITAKEVSITGAVIQPVTYDPNGYTLTVTGVTFDGVVDGETLAYTAEATLGNTNAVGEQDATVTVTLDNSNYNLATATYRTKVTINKAAATVTAAPTPNTLTYTGEGQYLISAGEANGGTIQYSTDNQNWSTTIPKGTAAGEYTVYYKVVGDENHSDTAADSVEVTIAKADPVVGTVGCEMALFDTTAASAVELTRTDMSVEGTLALTDSELTAGEGTYNWKFTPDDTDNYNTITGTVVLNVTADVLEQIRATGTLEKFSYVYGEPFSIDGMTVTASYTSGTTKDVTGLVSFDSTLAVGQTAVELTYQGKICVIDGITVAKKQLVIDRMAWVIPENAVYSGTAYNATLTGDLPEGVTVTKTGDTATNAGSYTAKAVFSLAEGYSADNYEIVNGGDLTADWTIAKKNIAGATITLGTALTYNGKQQTQTVTKVEIDGLTVTCTVSGNTGTDAKGYTLTVNGNGNFEGAETKEWSIAKKNISGATITLGDSLTYIGNEQTQKVIGVKIGDLPVTYDVTANKQTNAGNYTLTVTGNGNFEGSATADWSIAKAKLTITANNNSITYGDVPAANGVTGTGFVSSESIEDLSGELTYSYYYVQFGNVGTYKITPSGVTSNNYEITFADGTLTVNAKTIAVTADAFSKTYGDTDPTLTYKVEGLINGDELTGKLSREEGENVGSYAIEQNTLTAGNNYAISYTGAKLIINKRSVTVAAKDQTVYYGNSISNTEITANGLVDGHSVTATLTPSTTNVTVDGTITASEAIITAGTADVTANYEIIYADGKLVIEPDMSKIAGLTTDNVTSANEADIKAVQEMMANADSVKDEWADISTTCEDLIEKIEAVEAQKKEATDKAASFNEDTVKSADKEDLTQLTEEIEALLDTDNLTEDERIALETVLEQVNGMIDTIEDTAEESKAATDAIDALNAATVTSADKGKLEQAIETIEDLLAGDNLTEEEAKTLEDAKADAKALIDVINAAAGATGTENTEKVEDVTPENVIPEDKTDLEKAKADLEKAIEDNGGNYTEDEKKAIRDEIDRIDSAITALENVESMTESVSQLPESVEPDNESEAEKILAAKEAYDALTEHEKSLVGEGVKKKLDNLVASLTAYDIVKGDGSSWTEDSNGTISFTVNGAFSKFVGIKVDGVDVGKTNYEARAGSTIITLKASYLDTLKVGEHTITVVYSDGSTDGTFKIVAKPSTPTTGDDFNIALYGSLIVISVTALVVLLMVSKKRKNAK